MAIKESFVPGVFWGSLQSVFRVEGDNPWQSYSTKEAARKREAELAAEADRTSIPRDEV